MNKVTAAESVLIAATPEAVWDYTQNWRNRAAWDWSVTGAEYLSESAPVVVRAHGLGGLRFKVTYKTSDRPRLTTLVMTELSSRLLKGGGGSWKYEAQDGGMTKWTQHNTLVLADGWLGRLARPFFAAVLTFTTRSIMRRAKRRIERGRS